MVTVLAGVLPLWSLGSSSAQTLPQKAADSSQRARETGQTSASSDSDATPGYGVESALILLPLESRQWESLAELDSQSNDAALAERAPGATGDEAQEDDAQLARSTSDAGAPSTGLSVSGLAAMHNAETIDGLSAQQYFRAGPRGAAAGGPNLRSTYSQSAVQAFRVLSNNFSAQFGASSGGVGARLEITSRSATEQLHGSAFVQLRESAWAATNPYSIETHYNNGVITSSPVKPSGSLTELGGAAGATLPWHWALQRRAGLFASLELQLRDDHIVSTPAVASFYTLTTNQISLLGNRGVTTAQTNTALNYLDSLSGTTGRLATRLLGDLRADAMLTPRDRMWLGYSSHRLHAPAGATLGQASDAVVARGRGSLGDSTVLVDALAANWTHSFSPRFDNELRGQIARDDESETPRTPLTQEPAIGPGGLAPQVSIAPNGFAYGTPADLARTAYPDEMRFELADTLHVRAGRHTLSLGADWSRVHDRVASETATEGAFLYDSTTEYSSTTGGHAGGLVDWITDYTYNVNAYPNGACPQIPPNPPPTNPKPHYPCFREYTQSFGPAATEFTTQQFAGFAEDTLRLRRDVSVTVGARYDYTLLPLPQGPNPTLDADVAALALPFGGATAAFPEDRNNFGPRIAATWSPRWRSKTALFTAHAGYGAFFGRTPGATVRAALADTALPTTALHIRITPTTTTLCPQVTTTQQGFGYPCAYTSTPPAAVAQTTSTTLFSNRFREPAVQRATLTLERAIGPHSEVRVGYSMALATQLPQSVDLNIAPSTTAANFILQGGDGHPGLHTGETFVVPLYITRPISQYGPVTALVSNANATYHALTAEAQLRGGRGVARSLELRGSYTFSRALDYGPQSSATPGHDGQFDPFRDGYDKGLSSLHFPQRFSGDLLYTVRVAGGPEWARRALSGWRLAAIATAGSGAPYSYNVFGGTRLSGGRETINGSGGATYLPTVGRNTLRLPPRGRVDARLGRQFSVRQNLQIDASAEAFNLWNTRNLSSLETRAFVLETATSTTGTCPAVAVPTLLFQDAAAIACEGLTTPAFGTPTSSTTGASRERQIQLGIRVHF
jgi:hypothetical protein